MNKNKRMMFIKRKIRDLTVKMQPRILKSRANRCRSNDPPKEKTESIIHRFFSPTKVLSPLADKIERHLPTIQRKNYVQMQLQNKTRKNQNILNKINWIENLSKSNINRIIGFICYLYYLCNRLNNIYSNRIFGSKD